MVVGRYRGFLIVLCLLAVLPVVLGASYGLDVAPVKNDIFRNESAVYTITVDNFQSFDTRFQIYTIDPSWNIRTDPVTPAVPANSRQSFTLYVRPTGDASFGAQGLSVNFKDLGTGSLLKRELVVNLRSGSERIGEYAPAVTLDVFMPYEVDPREPVPVRLEMRNRNRLNITNLTVIVQSDHFSKTFQTSLPPLSERTRDVTNLRIDPLTPPGETEMLVQLIYNGEQLTRLEKNYRVEEYTTVQRNVQTDNAFFKTAKTVTVRNEGNVENTAVVSVPTSMLKTLFISSSIKHVREVQDGQSALVWRIDLAPNETRTFTYTENYRVLALLLLLIIGGGIAYLLLRSPLVMMKEAVGVAKEDGVSRIKVRIFLRNRSSRIIRDLQVTDRVPSLADVVETESPGTLNPNKMAVSEKKGTLLRWNLDVLEPYEERVLTYQAKSKLKIIGRMSLPKARARFTYKDKERAVHSNNIEVVERFREK